MRRGFREVRWGLETPVVVAGGRRKVGVECKVEVVGPALLP